MRSLVSNKRARLGMAGLALLLMTPLAANAQFTDVSLAAGVRFTHQGQSLLPPGGPDMGIGTGAAWFDFDNDGDLDLYVTNRTAAARLFRNNGNGTFTNVAASAGVQNTSNDGAGVAVADFDNDGDLDMYLANSDNDIFYTNDGDGTFTDATASAFGAAVGTFGLIPERGTSAAWGDYDNDGFVDLYVSNHMPFAGDFDLDDDSINDLSGQDYFFHNNGDGTFTDVSSLLAGDVDGDGEDDLRGFGFIGAFTDYDMDGDPDIYLMNDCPFGPEDNKLWRNDGGSDPLAWNFTEVSDALMAVNQDLLGKIETDDDPTFSGPPNPDCQNAMGIAWADYDHDGDFDYWYSNLESFNPNQPLPQSSTLLRNDGSAFQDVTSAAGIFENTVPSSGQGRITWGGNFLDFDLDGDEDLHVVAGAINDNSSVNPQENMFYVNNGDGTFTETVVGIENPRRSKTSVMGDFDGDGDPDIFLVNFGESTALYQNDNANGNNWLIVDLVGTTSNRSGIGAKIRVTDSNSMVHIREVRSGSSLGGGDDLGAYFGLGTATITEVEVEWPSGIVQTLTGPALNLVDVNQRLEITEEASEPASITVTAPNGGETFMVGTPVNITWSSTGITGNVQIRLLQDNVSVKVIANSTANDGSHTWNIPSTQAAGSNYKVRVTSVDDTSIKDASDANFTIEAPPSITVTAPNGGETFMAGTPMNITWSSTGITGNVQIRLLQDNVSVKVIANSTANDGSHTWNIPSTQAAGSNYKVRVTSVDDTSIKDASDANFTIDAVSGKVGASALAGSFSGDGFSAGIPTDYALEANYPNPFNPATTIRYALPEQAQVTLVVYDAMGREVRRLVDGLQGAGVHEVTFDAASLPSGVYIYRLEAGSFQQVRSMTLVK
jgi:hypothetical protein